MLLPESLTKIIDVVGPRVCASREIVRDEPDCGRAHPRIALASRLTCRPNLETPPALAGDNAINRMPNLGIRKPSFAPPPLRTRTKATNITLPRLRCSTRRIFRIAFAAAAGNTTATDDVRRPAQHRVTAAESYDDVNVPSSSRAASLKCFNGS